MTLNNYAFFMKDLALNQKNLSNRGKIKVRIQFCAAPNTSRLNPAVIGWRDNTIVRGAATVKQQRNISV
jgi:hypothetical protein